VEQPQSESEWRPQPHYAVDAEVTVLIVNQSVALRGRMFEISVDACGVRVDRAGFIITPASVEVIFKISGMAFRLGGTMRWMDAPPTAGIQFSPMAPRRREALLELLAELEAQGAANTASLTAQAGDPTGRKPDRGPTPTHAPAAILSMPAAARTIAGGSIESAGASWPAAANPAGPAVLMTSRAAKLEPKPPELARPAEPVPPAATPRSTRRDRRAEMRQMLETRATVFFIDVRAQMTGNIVDLSMSGCRIRTDEQFPVGIYRRVETEFTFDGLPFRLPGVVQAMHNKFTVGIRFLDMSSRKREQLTQLMEEIEEMRKAGNRE